VSDLALQFARFWSFQDRAVQTAVLGILLLSVSCGSLGCFIVLRRMSLLGDSLGHSVLPGVCLGFVVTWTKDPVWISIGAILAALLASWLIGAVERFTKLKPDVVLGLVLSGFFGLGLALLARLQYVGGGSQAGLNQFLFGQAAAIRGQDLWLIGVIAAVIVGGIVVFFKELAVTSFDASFAAAQGIQTRLIHLLLMTLTALAIVISIQAVGVVLLSALLITPAATAYLLTDRLRAMLLLSVGISALAGVLGLNLSFLGNFPTGPFVVLVLSLFFLAAYLGAPRHGVLTKAWRRRRRSQRKQRENLLKGIYLSFPGLNDGVSLVDLARLQRMPHRVLRTQLKSLEHHGWVEIGGDQIRLTDSGRQRAGELDRNYRLWELFLTNEVQLPSDHTQRDAEDIEHLLTPELAQELEERYGPPPSTGSPAEDGSGSGRQGR